MAREIFVGRVRPREVIEVQARYRELVPPSWMGDFAFSAYAFPNPFDRFTTIRFSLAQPSNVSLEVFDLLGREVATLVRSDLAYGPHSVTWDTSWASPGIYMYRLVENTGVAGGALIVAC